MNFVQSQSALDFVSNGKAAKPGELQYQARLPIIKALNPNTGKDKIESCDELVLGTRNDNTVSTETIKLRKKRLIQRMFKKVKRRYSAKGQEFRVHFKKLH